MNIKTFLKELTLTSFVLAIFFSSCTNEKISTLSGTIQNLDTIAEVKIYKQDFDRTHLVEIKKVNPKKPNFTFKLGELDEPAFIQLHIEGRRNNVAVLLIEPSEKVSMEIDLKDFVNYSLSGSESSLKTQLLSKRLAQSIRTIDSLTVRFNRAASDDERNRLSAQYNETIEAQRAFSTQFIWENPMSRASVMALYQRFSDDHFVFDRPDDIQLFKVVATSLIAMYPNSSYAKGMLSDIKNLERLVTTQNLQTIVQNLEHSLPEIALPNLKGDTIRLSSLRGKVILLDFWASNNQESLLENRELLDVYKQFRGRGFEIYQVSFDVEKEPWMAAIESAGLSWINVSELNPRGSVVALTYNVNRIPANYLIDRSYNIVGKDLYGKDLIAKLREIL